MKCSFQEYCYGKINGMAWRKGKLQFLESRHTQFEIFFHFQKHLFSLFSSSFNLYLFFNVHVSNIPVILLVYLSVLFHFYYTTCVPYERKLHGGIMKIVLCRWVDTWELTLQSGNKKQVSILLIGWMYSVL